jgi:muconolactone delta-isomerase
MKVMAIGTLKPLSPEQRQRYLPKEVPATLQLYLDGKMEQFWLRDKEEGVIFLMSVDSVDEADRLLKALPLGPGQPADVRPHADRPPAAAGHVDESEIATRHCVLRTCKNKPVEPLAVDRTRRG